ncbi:MAG: hypothetical protein K0Q52_1271 [Microbacterium sp.]|jgi:hypothetical protein|nr:hypothetical protein [Microbacterium sp.]
MSDNSNNNGQNCGSSAEPQLPPAGWHPDPHDLAAQRYWDAAQWTAHHAAAQTDAAATAFTPPAEVAASTAAFTPATTGVARGAVFARAGRGLPKLKWWQ